MTTVRTAPPGGLRVILCLKFNPHAAFKDVAACKRALIGNERVLHSVEVSGSFDFMFEADPGDLATYQTMLDDVAANWGHLLHQYEACFVCRRYVRAPDDAGRDLWLPTSSGVQRVAHGSIDKITAEGDYVRVHSGAQSWLLHSTMKRIADQFDPGRFFQIHRSLIVRADFVDRFRHHRRRWTVRLVDGSEHPVAKSRSASVVARLKVDSPVDNPGLAGDDTPNENLRNTAEIDVR